MAQITTLHKLNHGRHFSNFMSDLGMTSIAFDLVIGDVLSMVKFRRIFRREKLGFIMAFEALILRNLAVSLVDANMALQTTDPPLDILFVVEAYSLNREFALWLDMA